MFPFLRRYLSCPNIYSFSCFYFFWSSPIFIKTVCTSLGHSFGKHSLTLTLRGHIRRWPYMRVNPWPAFSSLMSVCPGNLNAASSPGSPPSLQCWAWILSQISLTYRTLPEPQVGSIPSVPHLNTHTCAWLFPRPLHSSNDIPVKSTSYTELQTPCGQVPGLFHPLLHPLCLVQSLAHIKCVCL
jgi:hypothetical protein